MADRASEIAGFLAQAGWGAARRRHLAGDASDRRYERLQRGTSTAVLMDNPPGGADDPVAFASMARHLCALGLSAPAILAEDLPRGLLLLEDLGDDLYARPLASDPAREAELYAPAVDVLLRLQHASPPPGLPNLSAEDWARGAGFALDWYALAATGTKPDPGAFRSALTTALRARADGPRVLILRDYHTFSPLGETSSIKTRIQELFCLWFGLSNILMQIVPITLILTKPNYVLQNGNKKIWTISSPVDSAAKWSGPGN